jgi:hypothetical protein
MAVKCSLVLLKLFPFFDQLKPDLLQIFLVKQLNMGFQHVFHQKHIVFHESQLSLTLIQFKDHCVASSKDFGVHDLVHLFASVS